MIQLFILTIMGLSQLTLLEAETNSTSLDSESYRTPVDPKVSFAMSIVGSGFIFSLLVVLVLKIYYSTQKEIDLIVPIYESSPSYCYDGDTDDDNEFKRSLFERSS